MSHCSALRRGDFPAATLAEASAGRGAKKDKMDSCSRFLNSSITQGKA